jgi:ketosteroid isomerase-like protein
MPVGTVQGQRIIHATGDTAMKRTFGCVVLVATMSCGYAAHAGSATTIAAFNQALTSATRTMDNAATLALWDDDGISLLPDTAPIVGKPAIADFLANVARHLHGAHMQQFELTCHDAHTAADWSSEWCDEHQVVVLANGQPPFDGRGRMLLVLHRGVHGWRIQREMWQPIKAP